MIGIGVSEPLGAQVRDGGTNFAVYSPFATRLELCLFDDAGQETRRFDLPAQTDGVWHGFVPGIVPGQSYGFRASGPYDAAAGLRFNPNKLLIDPYARALAGDFVWSDAVFDFQIQSGTELLVPSALDSAACVPKSVVTVPQRAPANRNSVPWSDTLIYELNVRGFSMRHPEIDDRDRGRFSALATKPLLQHFKALGITSIELLPIHAFIDEQFLRARGLRNFWGYNSLGYFAPHSPYLGAEGLGGLKRVVECLHEANIEVILDVVYNHTAEGGRLGPSLSFRGLANSSYYRLASDQPGEYINDTGCGNTINSDEPIVRRLIIDSLSYWVTEFGIDGFRFDLAPILGRTPDGFSREHRLFEEIQQTAALRDVKLIAEPWDVGPGGYQLGSFPIGWAEWNDQYRDAVRKFWRRDSDIAPEFARRVHGSSDIFEPGGRGPNASVNFVTSHDGFTTTDLVSFAERHNEANGEENRDGHGNNHSVNHGIEGPSDDPTVIAIRRLHRLNLLATLLFSQGTPMLLAGDEFGNSQSGNNNAYAQDNDIGWLDWSGLANDPAYFTEVCEIVRLREKLPLLRQAQHRHGEPSGIAGLKNIEWLSADGQRISEDQWQEMTALGVLYARPKNEDPEYNELIAVLLAFNTTDEDLDFVLPRIDAQGSWRIRYSSAGSDAKAVKGSNARIGRFSIACLTFSR